MWEPLNQMRIDDAMRRYVANIEEALRLDVGPLTQETRAPESFGDASGNLNELLRELADLNAENAQLMSEIRELQSSGSGNAAGRGAGGDDEKKASAQQKEVDLIAAALAEADDLFVSDCGVMTEPPRATLPAATGRNSLGAGAIETVPDTPLAAACKRLEKELFHPRVRNSSAATQTDSSVPLYQPLHDVSEELLASVGMSTFTTEYLRTTMQRISQADLNALAKKEPTLYAALLQNMHSHGRPASGAALDPKQIIGLYPCCVLVKSAWSCGWLFVTAQQGLFMSSADGNLTLMASYDTPFKVALGQSHESFRELYVDAKLDKHIPTPGSLPPPPIRQICESLNQSVKEFELLSQYHRSFTLELVVNNNGDDVPGSSGAGGSKAASLLPMGGGGQGNTDAAQKWHSVIFDTDADMTRFCTQLWLMTNDKQFDPFTHNYSVRDVTPVLCEAKRDHGVPVCFHEPYPLQRDDFFSAMSIFSPTEISLCRELHLHPRVYLEAAMSLIGDPSRTWFSLGDVAAALALPTAPVLPMFKADCVATFFEKHGFAERVQLIERLPASM